QMSTSQVSLRRFASSEMVVGAALALLTIAVFAVSCTNRFAYDDLLYVTDNPHVQAGLTPQSMTWAWTTTFGSNWHPLTWLSLEADASLSRLAGTSGMQPWIFHLTNVLLHVCNAFLLLHVLYRMTGVLWRSAMVAGLFAVHPLHVESVAWVA